MERSERVWHPNFIKYMEFIVGHPNYSGLPIERKRNGDLSWIATAKSEIGNGRIRWALNKAKELGIANQAGVYAKVMLEVHPTKQKVCQVCGCEMSLYYVYPNVNLVKALKKDYNYECSMVTHINKVVEDLLALGIRQDSIKEYFAKKMSIEGDFRVLSLKEVLQLCESRCRNGSSSLLGPGSMSNFPDRYDGFHTYNRCCRSTEDTGRSAENLKTYTKDRRAYEYWSDGNIQAANNFMGSLFFKGISADHIGPISLGFVHDPRYLRPMLKGENSSKRDRLLYKDIEECILVEKKTNVYAMSWYAANIWEYIKANYAKTPLKIENYRSALKINISNFMFILWTIKTIRGGEGVIFLKNTLLRPKMKYFKYIYSFNELGEIIDTKPRNITDATLKEYDRFVRIALEALDDYQKKENRNVRTCLDSADEQFLSQLCVNIKSNKDENENFTALTALNHRMQNKLINQL